MKEYKTIVADPPWGEYGGGGESWGEGAKGAQRYYPLMSTSKIISLMKDIVENQYDIAANSHLYLWVTVNFLEDGLSVMKSIGYRYIRPLIWIKGRLNPSPFGNLLKLDMFGLGQYFRGSMEMCLFGVSGSLPTKLNNCRDIFFEHRREHSQKPEIFYKIVESQSYPEYLEIFSREQRKGWDNWGNQAEEQQKRMLF